MGAEAGGPVPDRAPEHAGLPARRLSAAEVEAVLRRAVELQAKESEGTAVGEVMDEAELVRIGQEIGLSPQHVQRALAETSAAPAVEEGWFGRGFGAGTVRVSRYVPRSAASVRAEIDQYLRERESMVVQRRFPDRAVYVPASGVTATFQRAAAQMSGRYPLLNVRELEVGIRAVEPTACFVSISVNLRGQRAGLAAGGLAAGSGSGAAAAAFLAIAIAPPAAILGAPVLFASLAGFRAIYRHTYSRTQTQLESLLDRLEHRELTPPLAGWRQRLGF